MVKNPAIRALRKVGKVKNSRQSNYIAVGESALHLAIVNGDLPSVKYLVSKGADVNHRHSKNVFFDKDKKIVSAVTDSEKYRSK